MLAGSSYCAIAVHHLAIDIVSWHIILDDLERTLQGQMKPIPEHSSFFDWSKHVSQLRQHEGLLIQRNQEVTVSQFRHPNTKIAPAFEEMSIYNTVLSSRVLSFNIDPSSTSWLLMEANTAYRTEAVDLLLSGLVMAFKRWRNMNKIEIRFASHGRDFRNESLDVSRTVGWFTYMFDILLSFPANTPLDQRIAHVKDARSNCTANSGFSKHFEIMTNHPVICFNYSGAYSNSNVNTTSPVIELAENRRDEDPQNCRSAVLDIGCSVVDGSLIMAIIYSTALHEEHEVSALLRLWQLSMADKLNFCRESHYKYHFTSSDLSFFTIEYADLTKLVETSLLPYGLEPRMVENILEATDMQRAMVLQSQESGCYIESFSYDIEGEIDILMFIKAWSEVVAKHSVLRTVFVPCGLQGQNWDNQMLQVILRMDNLEERVFLEKPNTKTFTAEYGKSLTRCYIYDTKEKGFHFTWQYHHAIVDGWSSNIILRDFESAYLGKHIASISEFKQAAIQINAWSRSSATGAFWRTQLMEAPPTILVDYTNDTMNNDKNQFDSRFEWGLDCSVRKLEDFAASHSLTPSVILRAA